MWLTEEAIAAWQAPATGKRGGQPIYSAIAIETSLALRLVFHQPLRQTEGLLRSIADVLKIDIAIPDHTTLSRPGGLTILPKRIHRAEPKRLQRVSFYFCSPPPWIRTSRLEPPSRNPPNISV